MNDTLHIIKNMTYGISSVVLALSMSACGPRRITHMNYDPPTMVPIEQRFDIEYNLKRVGEQEFAVPIVQDYHLIAFERALSQVKQAFDVAGYRVNPSAPTSGNVLSIEYAPYVRVLEDRIESWSHSCVSMINVPDPGIPRGIGEGRSTPHCRYEWEMGHKFSYVDILQAMPYSALGEGEGNVVIMTEQGEEIELGCKNEAIAFMLAKSLRDISFIRRGILDYQSLPSKIRFELSEAKERQNTYLKELNHAKKEVSDKLDSTDTTWQKLMK